MWCLPMTSSTRYFVEAGTVKPETRFTAIKSSPAAKIPRRGLISAHTCGRFFHAFLVFLGLEGARVSFSVGISGGRSEPLVLGCLGVWPCYIGHCCHPTCCVSRRQFRRARREQPSGCPGSKP